MKQHPAMAIATAERTGGESLAQQEEIKDACSTKSEKDKM
jgi:hypothetical protein